METEGFADRELFRHIRRSENVIESEALASRTQLRGHLESAHSDSTYQLVRSAPPPPKAYAFEMRTFEAPGVDDL